MGSYVLNQNAHLLICFLCCLLLSSSACPLAQFKWGTEGQCTTCPGFSYTTTRGASVCVCRSGYLRAKSDTPDTPCTSKCAEKLLLCFFTFFLVQFSSGHGHCLCCRSPLVSFSQLSPAQSTFVSIVTQPSIQMHVFCDRLLGEGRSVEVGIDGPGNTSNGFSAI